MDRANHMRIIAELCDGVKADMLAAVAAGKIPEEWNGHELRELFVLKAGMLRSNYTMKDHRSGRYKNFRNHCIINNLY